MKIRIEEVQPSQLFLCEEAVNFFEKNKTDPRAYEDPIIVYECENEAFAYLIKEGHHRLTACLRRNIQTLDINPIQNPPKNMIRASYNARNAGIRSVRDLEKHLLPSFICRFIIGQ